MILAIDIGNSITEVGCIAQDGRVLMRERLSTDLKRTEIEYAVSIRSALRIHHIDPCDIKGGIIASVVPPLTDTMSAGVEKLTGSSAMVVGPGLKTGLNIVIDDPSTLGSDLLVDAVAALAGHEPPLIVIDIGTATTLCVVDEKRRYIGGILAPGVRTGLNSLVDHTSLLQQISLDPPKKLVGSNTIDAMKSGILYGQAAMIDGLIDQITENLGRKCSLIGTGIFARRIIPLCSHGITLDHDLLMKGLKIIYDKNKNVTKR